MKGEIVDIENRQLNISTFSMKILNFYHITSIHVVNF